MVSTNPLDYYKLRKLPLWLLYAYAIAKKRVFELPENNTSQEELEKLGLGMSE